MTTKDEALKLALEALDVLLTEPIAHKAADRAEYLLLQAAPAIREALAEQPAQPIKQGWDVDTLLNKPKQPAQQPPTVAELLCVCGAEWEWRNRDWELVAIPPAQRKPLTNEQALQMSYKHEWLKKLGMREAYRTGIRDAESAHGIKGDA